MLLSLEEEDRNNIALLNDLSIDVIGELCQLAVDSLDKGIHTKTQQAFAKKLGLEAESVQRILDSVLFVFTESSKHNLNEVDFHDSLVAAGVNDDICKALSEQYVSCLSHIRSILKEMSPSLPQYHNMEWRLEVQLASRCLHHQVAPQILLKLHTKDGDKTKTTLLQTDPVNLLHLTESLEQALDEVKTAHCRRILRNI